MTAERLKVFKTVAVALLAGVGGWLLSGSLTPQRIVATEPASLAEQDVARPVVAADGPAGPASRPARRSRGGQRPDTGSAPMDDPSPEPESHDLIGREVRAQRTLLASFDAEAEAKSQWSTATETSIRETLSPLADQKEGSFSVVDVQCRSTMCVATLQWESYYAAQGSFESAVNASYVVACRKKMTIAPPADPGAVYQAPVVFQCDPDADVED